jgi:hypothetical protein
MMKTKRLGEGIYAICGTTLQVQKQENCSIEDIPCEHPLCERIHRKYWKTDRVGSIYCDAPRKFRVEWVVIDTMTGDRAFDGESYETLTEAKKEIIRRMGA